MLKDSIVYHVLLTKISGYSSLVQGQYDVAGRGPRNVTKRNVSYLNPLRDEKLVVCKSLPQSSEWHLGEVKWRNTNMHIVRR